MRLIGGLLFPRGSSNDDRPKNKPNPNKNPGGPTGPTGPKPDGTKVIKVASDKQGPAGASGPR